MIETFVHQFSNGITIKLDFDLSKDMPYCVSNLKFDKQPNEILIEYRVWLDKVVLPVVIEKCTPSQLLNFARFGKRIMEERK